MRLADALLRVKGRAVLKIHVVPRSRDYSIHYDELRQELKIRVKANPEGGKANADLIKYFSQYFRTPEILSGHTKRSKRIAVNHTVEEAVAILEEIIT